MDKEKLSTLGAVALNSIFGFEPKFSHRIISALGSPEKIFTLSREELLRIFGPYNKYLPLICEESLRKAELLVNDLSEKGFGVIGINDECYPSLLKDCDDAPMALFVRSGGKVSELFNSRPAISIVGTRDISPYGQEWCIRIVRALSESPCKPIIVSGMAIGVDITAHLAALNFGLPTVGVLPVGIDDVYPRRHRVAAEKICSAGGGAMITDYPPGTCPVAFNFLRRNRIIAGISSATILVESKEKGGGTMTARLASGYGREVFALPGRIDDVRSRGCNRLLREKLAEPIYSLDELPEMLGLGRWNRRNSADLEEEIKNRYDGMTDEGTSADLLAAAALIKKNRGICLDELCRELDMEYSRVSQLVGLLENDGFIEVDLMQRCCINAKKY